MRKRIGELARRGCGTRARLWIVKSPRTRSDRPRCSAFDRRLSRTPEASLANGSSFGSARIVKMTEATERFGQRVKRLRTAADSACWRSPTRLGVPKWRLAFAAQADQRSRACWSACAWRNSLASCNERSGRAEYPEPLALSVGGKKRQVGPLWPHKPSSLAAFMVLSRSGVRARKVRELFYVEGKAQTSKARAVPTDDKDRREHHLPITAAAGLEKLDRPRGGEHRDRVVCLAGIQYVRASFRDRNDYAPWVSW